LAGTQLRALSHEHRLLHACVHAALGNWPPRLASLRDVAEIALYGAYDAGDLLRIAERWRIEGVVARAVSLAWQTLQIADITALSCWAEEYQPTKTELRWMSVYVAGNTSYAAKCRAALSAIPGARGRLSFARMLLFPSREFLDESQGSALDWWARGLRRSGIRP
jgi:hypothetical protein